ncbi:hypothetical protein [Aeromonas sobria]|uniref:hypothetical protein n=1 Tax=Aeromonas sobria TaxID=646 RepID=UPI00165271E4|nr:hypothetical protein [Aeromonas sobria]
MLNLSPQDAMSGSPLGNLITEKLIKAATIAKIAGEVILYFIEGDFHYQNPCLAMNVFAYSIVLRVAPGALFATIQIERLRPFIAIDRKTAADYQLVTGPPPHLSQPGRHRAFFLPKFGNGFKRV